MRDCEYQQSQQYTYVYIYIYRSLGSPNVRGPLYFLGICGSLHPHIFGYPKKMTCFFLVQLELNHIVQQVYLYYLCGKLKESILLYTVLNVEAINHVHRYVGDCQNYGPFLGPYYNTGPNTGPNWGPTKGP